MAGRSYLRLLSSRRSRHRLPGPGLNDGLRTGHGKAGEPMLAAQGYIAAGGDPALGRIALVAVAITVVGVFTVLQIRARSRRSAAGPAASAARRPPALGARRRPVLGARRARAGRDWRTLAPLTNGRRLVIMTTTGRSGDTDHHGATAVTTDPGIVLTTVPGTAATTPRRRMRNRASGGPDEPAGFLIATERV